jgi:uncharacterized protein involved in outer membrane biogenesis
MRPLWRWTLGIGAALVVAVAAVIVFFDWNWLKPPLEGRLSSLTGKEVHIDGPISGTRSWVPHITLDHVRIEDPSFRSAPKVAVIDEVEVEINLMRLLGGTLDFPKIEIDRPVLDLQRNANGKVNWNIASEASGPSSRSSMPMIEMLKIDNGRVSYRDLAKNLTIEATIATISATGGAGEEKLTLTGRGTYRKVPFELRLKGGSLEHLRETREPYDLDLSAAVGNTKVTVNGTVTDPFKLTGMNVKLTAQGA